MSRANHYRITADGVDYEIDSIQSRDGGTLIVKRQGVGDYARPTEIGRLSAEAWKVLCALRDEFNEPPKAELVQ